MRYNEQNLEQALRSHDWYYKMADDPIFTNGKFERDHIHTMMADVGEERSRELWSTWAPNIELPSFPGYLFS